MNDFSNTDQRQLQLFPEGDAKLPAAIVLSSQCNSTDQQAKVVFLFDKKKAKENDAEQALTRKVLALLAL